MVFCLLPASSAVSQNAQLAILDMLAVAFTIEDASAPHALVGADRAGLQLKALPTEILNSHRHFCWLWTLTFSLHVASINSRRHRAPGRRHPCNCCFYPLLLTAYYSVLTTHYLLLATYCRLIAFS